MYCCNYTYKKGYLKSEMNVFPGCFTALDYFLLKTTTIFRPRKMLKVAGSLQVPNIPHKATLSGPTKQRAA